MLVLHIVQSGVFLTIITVYFLFFLDTLQTAFATHYAWYDASTFATRSNVDLLSGMCWLGVGEISLSSTSHLGLLPRSRP
jgi:hypothetical protein